VIIGECSSAHYLRSSRLQGPSPPQQRFRINAYKSPQKGQLLPTLLKAKLANCADIDQAKRDDVRQTRILIACVNAYLKLALSETEHGKTSERATTNVLEALWSICNGEKNRATADKFGMKLEEAFPSEVEQSSLGKVQRFFHHRLMPLRVALQIDRAATEVAKRLATPSGPVPEIG